MTARRSRFETVDECHDDSVSTKLELPRLQGAPLLLRAFTSADAALVAEAGTDPLIPPITTVPTAPAGPAAVQAFIDRQHERARSGQGYSFVIADADTDVGLGQIGLWPHGQGRASVGYWVAASARRQGVAHHALQVVSAWGVWPCRACTGWSCTWNRGTKARGMPQNEPATSARACYAVGSPSMASDATCICTPGFRPTPPVSANRPRTGDGSAYGTVAATWPLGSRGASEAVR